MVTKKEVLDALKKKYDIDYDEEKDLINYQGTTMSMEKIYQKYLKENGMSFKCICDVHWECMSVIECTECGTVVKEYYDEFYEPNFRCPTCTDYKTGYEYYTKEQIDSSEEIQAIINMYKNLNQIMQEQDNRRKQRNGLEDYQLLQPRQIKLGNYIYRFSLLIDSITNKNKLQGLKLEINKFEKKDSILELKKSKIVPLSKKAYYFYKQLLPEYEKNPEMHNLGMSLTQLMEENAVRRIQVKK